MPPTIWRGRCGRLAVQSVLFCVLAEFGCAPIPVPPDGGNAAGDFNNTTDPTNRGANYIGSRACAACHSSIGEQHALHGHSQILKKVDGQPPQYPEAASRAGVPQPPPGLEWSDIAYVVGGYIRKSVFIDNDGYFVAGADPGPPVQWNLAFPPNGSEAGFAAYEDEVAGYDFSCFRCHTTGPQSLSEENPQRQDNRPGIAGTWEEPGVQCEACHGPGSNHVPNPAARDIYVGISADNCGKCHTRSGPDIILAGGGFIRSYQQWSELRASGGHSGFSCVTCHDPHSGTNYDRARAIRNECTACHSNQNMAIHEGFTFVRGNYSETLTCVSCHMPFASRSAASATVTVAGEIGEIGDLRTHIFRIDTDPEDFRTFFVPDGTQVAKNNNGLAAVTLDFVCFRCHNGVGNAFAIDSLELASGVASNIHAIAAPAGKTSVRDSD